MTTLAKTDLTELVAAAREGDQWAWRELFTRFMPLLRKVAGQHRLTAEEAADVVQMTWLRCLEHVRQLQDDERFAGWIGSICRRECLAAVNRRRREVPLELVLEPATQLSGPEPEKQDPCWEAIRQDEGLRLRQAIGRLPVRQRTVVLEMLESEGDGYVEISRRLRIPVGSIGPTRQRALSRLRNDLG
jgi:RNA polymerase sigma factor (sigma-70 family)